jgi:branched-chain amino acid transport system ATP-binding protein
MEYILDVQNIHTFIGQYHILQGVNVRVPKGSIVALLGRNGAGKTTTLKSILGLTPPREGKVIYEGKEVQGTRSFDIAAKGIGFVPEHRAIFRDLTVEENLKIAERNKGDYLRKKDFIFNLIPRPQTPDRAARHKSFRRAAANARHCARPRCRQSPAADR